MNGMNEAILAVAQAQQGDAIPVDIPPMTQSAPDMGKPPVTPKTKIGTVEEPQLWPEIRQLIEADIANAPRELQREIGPSELGTDCVHCLAAKLAGWPERRSPGWLPFIGTCVHAHFETMFHDLNGEPAIQFPYTSEDNVTELVEMVALGVPGHRRPVAGFARRLRRDRQHRPMGPQNPQHHRLEGSRQHDRHQGQGPRPLATVPGRGLTLGMGLQNEGEGWSATASTSCPATRPRWVTHCHGRPGSTRSPANGR